MNTDDLQSFVNNLCADEFEKLFRLIKNTGDSLLTSKVSNHQIIHLEHTYDSIQTCPLCGSVPYCQKRPHSVKDFLPCHETDFLSCH